MSEDERDMLHSSLIWDQDGHLSDIAQNAIVDAESALLPREACEHAETCEQCMRSIGQLAQFSLEIDGALKQINLALLPSRAAPLSTRPARPARHWPFAELGFALLLALLGQLPTLQALNPSGLRHAFKALTRVGVQVLERVLGSELGAALPWIATALLVAVSGSIAYAARHRLASNFANQLSTRPRG
jgi:hypothetical protein